MWFLLLQKFNVTTCILILRLEKFNVIRKWFTLETLKFVGVSFLKLFYWAQHCFLWVPGPLPTNYYPQGFMILYVILTWYMALNGSIEDLILIRLSFFIEANLRNNILTNLKKNYKSEKLASINFNDSTDSTCHLVDDLRFRLNYIGLKFDALNA